MPNGAEAAKAANNPIDQPYLMRNSATCDTSGPA
jgi:hypothetical protein